MTRQNLIRAAFLILPIAVILAIVLSLANTPKSKEALLNSARAYVQEFRQVGGEDRAKRAVAEYEALIRDHAFTDEAKQARKELAEAHELFGNAQAAADWQLQYARYCDNQNLAAEAVWKAIELYEKAGAQPKLASTYEMFMQEHPFNARLPEVKYRWLMMRRDRQGAASIRRDLESFVSTFRYFDRRPELMMLLEEICEGEGDWSGALQWCDRVLSETEALTIFLPALGRKLALARRGVSGVDVASLHEALEGRVNLAARTVLMALRAYLLKDPQR